MNINTSIIMLLLSFFSSSLLCMKQDEQDDKPLQKTTTITSRNPFFVYPKRQERLYKNLLYAELPINMTELNRFPLNRIKSGKLREFIIASCLSQLSKIRAKEKCIGRGLAYYVLQYVPIESFNYSLMYKRPVYSASLEYFFPRINYGS